MVKKLYFPGDEICTVSSSTIAGPGTQIHGNRVVASRLGYLNTCRLPAERWKHEHYTSSSTASSNSAMSRRAFKDVYEVKSAVADGDVCFPCKPFTFLPTIGTIVLARVLRLTVAKAFLSILAVDRETCDTLSSPLATRDCLSQLYPCPVPFTGQIRVQDIRATEKDKVDMIESFHLNDIIRAIVISLGDGAYFLSTARNDLGVVMAWSDQLFASQCEQLLPISWKEMIAVNSRCVENRKVAKPF